MRVIRASEQKRMPWKNGGGVTSEIVVAPGTEGRFLYRVSVADVASSGPFSRFDGYERHIMLLEGAGMTLDCGAHGTIALQRFEPKTFSGDWDVTGTLTNGPVRDFNLIVDRARVSADLRVRKCGHIPGLDSPTIYSFRGTFIAHVLEGQLDQASVGDTLITIDEDMRLTGSATLALMNITPR